MKKLLVIVALVAFAFNTWAQQVDLRRKIEVSGTAEQEITPDIINVTVSLKEYIKGGKKITISTLEAKLQKAVNEAGISKEDFTINDVSSWDWDERKKNTFLASKQYGIRFHELKKYNQILSKLDQKGVESTEISSYDHTRMAAFKKELKIKALLAAKDKAEYLLASVGEKLGAPLDINETDNISTFAAQYKSYNSFANVSGYTAAPSDSNINFKSIKLSFQVSAVFEIK
ncbi:SIMPL domain-containing protein [Mucilaginibacter sp.]|uniref:SIMPL domain-containing protein n=1 Tax=Mucilaginibacter sp. TaxID=1882438 RepID=UPI003265BF32